MDRNAVDAPGPRVTGFSGGGFRVDDKVYHALLLTPERADGWSPPALAELAGSDVAGVLDGMPEFLLLGTGAQLTRPPVAFVQALEARGIGVEAMDSRAAARAWGVLRAEGRQVVAAFYPIG